MVWLNTKNLTLKHPGTRKLLPRYVGPFKIMQRVAEVAYKLKLPAKLKMHDVFHVSLLKPYRSDGRYPAMPEVIDLTGELSYQVDTILAHRERRAGGRGRSRTLTSYLVKYADLSPEYNAWVPEKQLLRDCPTVLQAYFFYFFFGYTSYNERSQATCKYPSKGPTREWHNLTSTTP
jgi:hypothetical protein